MSRDTSANIQNILRQLPFLRVSLPPVPWRMNALRAVGGLREVGFAPASDLLLIVSSQGRGLLDCQTGTLVAGDDDHSLDWLDGRELLAEGIGLLAGQNIRVAGLSGGGLASGTPDGWCVETETFQWPERSVFLKTPDWYTFSTAAEGCFKLVGESELRAVGFSSTGLSLVVATSSELSVYTRWAAVSLT